MIELLKGEKDLNTIATENNIQPNLLRNWKKEFLDKASVVFDDTREDNLKEKLALERKEKAEYAKKVGQLTMQVDWLKKKSEETLVRLISRSAAPVLTGSSLVFKRFWTKFTLVVSSKCFFRFFLSQSTCMVN